MKPKMPWRACAAMAILVGAVISLQASGIPGTLPPAPASVPGVPSPAVVGALSLSYDSVAADYYWIRAIQYFGSTRLSTAPDKRYDRLYPLLDLTTTMDPRFGAAYLFGAVFLAEPLPGGPGRPDLGRGIGRPRA